MVSANRPAQPGAPDSFLTLESVNELTEIALSAGAAIMDIYESEERLQSESKADHSPVTQADLAANNVILAALKKIAPDIPVLSEESPWVSGDASTYWAVDPLDGTKEFLARNGDFTVNIALVIDGVARLGVIHAPVLNTVWAGMLPVNEPWAGKAEMSSFDKVIAPIHWSPVRVTSDPVDPYWSPMRLLSSRSHTGDEMPHWLHLAVSKAKVANRGSSLKFCLIAQGDADVYVRLGPTSIWDTAAGQAILTAAGGVVVECASNTELRYANPTAVLNPNFLAYAPNRLGYDAYSL